MARRKREDEGAGIGTGFDGAALEALLGGRKTIGEVEELFRGIKKALIEKALEGELTHHLGYERGEEKPLEQPNHRNGSSSKTVRTDDDEISLSIPRDRAGTFEPQLVPKGVRRLPGFDAKVLSLYARGMTVREIRGHLEELYHVHISPDVVSAVTDAVLEEVKAWQQRPLEMFYPVVVFDALRVKIRDEGVVRNKAVYLALGIARDGTKDILGLWIEQTEGAAFWLKVMTELKSRGVQDILVALVDGLVGFPDAITTVFPQTQVHQCTVHLVRQSLRYANWKDRKQVASELRSIYSAPTAEAARAALDAFDVSPFGKQYPPIALLWRRHWEFIEPVFAYPPEIRRLLYTTNAIESFHMQLRKIIKNRGHFPNDEAAAKLLYLAIRNIIGKWQGTSREWARAMPYLGMLFGDRFMSQV